MVSSSSILVTSDKLMELTMWIPSSFGIWVRHMSIRLKTCWAMISTSAFVLLITWILMELVTRFEPVLRWQIHMRQVANDGGPGPLHAARNDDKGLFAVNFRIFVQGDVEGDA